MDTDYVLTSVNRNASVSIGRRAASTGPQGGCPQPGVR